MEKKYGALLLGAGFWGKKWIERLNNCDRIEFKGIACSPAEKEDIVKLSKLPEKQVYCDYREAIECSDADIMINVLPAELHFDADRLALQKGMNIIAEKPLVKNRDEAEELLKIMKACKGQLFMVSQNYRWRPHNVTIKNALKDGMIGSLESITWNFRRKEDLQGYRKNLEFPLLNDMLIHHVDLMRFFCEADCEEITANAWRPSWSEYQGKPNLDAIIHMKNGVEVSYTGSWAARGMESSWDGDIILSGSKGCLTLDADNVVSFYPTKSDNSEVLDTCKQKPVVLDNVVMDYEEADYGLRYFIECLDEGKVPVTCLEDNYKSFSMVLSCEEAVRTKKTVKV